jgi:uncharacterized membrane protein HdeD (DUF308 family)
MTVPPWLTFLIAGMVIFFGLYRLWIALRSSPRTASALPPKGLYGLPRRRHFLYGIVYLLLGGILIATALGYAILPPLFR